MKEFIINSNECGQRFDKYLAKCMKNASVGFIYKMLRKKNITLNGKKAEGRELLTEGDIVKIYLSDDTFEKMRGVPLRNDLFISSDIKKSFSENILYEDDNILLLNKPSGMLSQRSENSDISAVELLIDHCLEIGFLTDKDLNTFKPSFCNRLDRNTTGILAAGKTLEALQTLNKMFHDRTVEKYYLCLVAGHFPENMLVQGYLKKDSKTNKVTVYDREIDGAVEILTGYEVNRYFKENTLLRIHLYTGKPHQIRAHLSYLNYPVVGDDKYGDRRINEHFNKKYGLTSQFLHACELKFPEDIRGSLSYLSGLTFSAPMCRLFTEILNRI